MVFDFDTHEKPYTQIRDFMENKKWVYCACKQIADAIGLDIDMVWSKIDGDNEKYYKKYSNTIKFIKNYKSQFIMIKNACTIIADKFNLNMDDIWAVISPNNTIKDFEKYYKKTKSIYDYSFGNSGHKDRYLYNKYKKIISENEPNITYTTLRRKILAMMQNPSEEDKEEAEKYHNEKMIEFNNWVKNLQKIIDEQDSPIKYQDDTNNYDDYQSIINDNEKYKRIGEGLTMYSINHTSTKWIFSACKQICEKHSLDINTVWKYVASTREGLYFKKYHNIKQFIDKSEQNFYMLWDIVEMIARKENKDVHVLWKTISDTPILDYVKKYAMYESIYH